MATLSKEIQDAVVGNCQVQSGEIVASLSRALGLTFEGLVTAEPHPLATFVAAPSGPGLVAMLMVGSAAVVLAIPNDEQILPPWCPAPDKAGESRLATLGQELGMLLLPDDVMAEDCRSGWVQHVGQAITRAKLADEAASDVAGQGRWRSHFAIVHGLASSGPGGCLGRTCETCCVSATAGGARSSAATGRPASSRSTPARFHE